MPDPRIVLFGATGFTGRLVARELAAGDTPFVLAGRSPAKLERLAAEIGGASTQTADAMDAASLDHLIRPRDVVIDCAGPFTELGEPVVRACIGAGAHYVDTTGEQAFMNRILDRCDADARAAGSIIVNAMAFEYALGDCAAAVAADDVARPLRSVEVVYAWGGGAAASRGTLRSMLRIITAPRTVFADGEFRRDRGGLDTTVLDLSDGRRRAAVAFPSGEILTVPRHVDVRDVRAWMVVGRRTARLAGLFGPLLPPLIRLATPLLDRLIGRADEGPSEEQRRAGRFLLTVDARGAGGERRRVDVRGHDAYGLTAVIAVHGALRIMELTAGPEAERPTGAPPAGVLPPAAVLEPRPFLDGLGEHGLEWEVDGA